MSRSDTEVVTPDGSQAHWRTQEMLLLQQVMGLIGRSLGSDVVLREMLHLMSELLGLTLQTSAPGVHALGDCISLAGTPCRGGEWRVVEVDDNWLLMQQWHDGRPVATLEAGVAKTRLAA